MASHTRRITGPGDLLHQLPQAKFSNHLRSLRHDHLICRHSDPRSGMSSWPWRDSRTSRHDGGLMHRVRAGGVQRHQRVPALMVCCEPPVLLVDHRALSHQHQCSVPRLSEYSRSIPSEVGLLHKYQSGGYSRRTGEIPARQTVTAMTSAASWCAGKLETRAACRRSAWPRDNQAWCAACLALCAHHDAVLGVLEGGHRDRRRPITRRPQRRQVHQVRQICAAEARRAARDHLPPATDFNFDTSCS